MYSFIWLTSLPFFVAFVLFVRLAWCIPHTLDSTVQSTLFGVSDVDLLTANMHLVSGF